MLEATTDPRKLLAPRPAFRVIVLAVTALVLEFGEKHATSTSGASQFISSEKI